MTSKHFVTVWNPSYSSTAMEAHLGVLLRWVGRYNDGGKAAGAEDTVYVWWGKVRSANRQKPLPHIAEILEVGVHEDSDDEQHLYLTDYRSLYVAHVGEVTDDDPRRDDGDHVPPYYADQQLNCDCWFRAYDIRRLVDDDTVAVVEELAQLRNTHYQDRPVSIYGGMVDLPLIVTREPPVEYFADELRDLVTGGTPWVQFDAERTGTGAMERELRENLFGEKSWRQLDPSVRTFVASAEKVFRGSRDDPAFDFAPVLLNLTKALEVQAHGALRTLLRSARPADRTVHVEGRQRDLATEALTLGQIGPALDDQKLFRLLSSKGPAASWFVSTFPSIAADLAKARNPAAHESRVGLQRALDVRNRVLGIGSESVLTLIARAGA